MYDGGRAKAFAMSDILEINVFIPFPFPSILERSLLERLYLWHFVTVEFIFHITTDINGSYV
jgi:hypothetical protein